MVKKFPIVLEKMPQKLRGDFFWLTPYTVLEKHIRNTAVSKHINSKQQVHVIIPNKIKILDIALNRWTHAENECAHRQWQNCSYLFLLTEHFINRTLLLSTTVFVIHILQEAQLLLGDRAMRKHAKDCWNGRGNDNLGWNDLQMYFKVIKMAPIES